MSDYRTTLNELPADWNVRRIDEIGSVVSGGTPSRDVPAYWNGRVAWVTPGELTRLDSKHICATNECITEAGLANSGATLLPPGSLLVTTRATLGAAAINGMPIATNQGFKSVVFRNGHLSDYYYHWTRKLKVELERRASGTTFAEISGSEFKSIEVPVPPAAEQSAIARVLDTLDTQIEKTQALVAKLEQVKEGLLHDLLTRGVDENGELRPSAEEAPELYKESALGLIPRGWDVRAIGSLAERVTNGFVGVATPHYVSEDRGIAYLYGNNIRADKIDLRKVLHVSRSFHQTQSKSQLRHGDMLTVQSGHIGTTAIFDQSLGEANCHALIITRFRSANVDPWFVSLYLNSTLGMRRQNRIFIGSTILHINTSDLAKFPVPLPTLAEQGLCVSHANSIQTRIDFEEAKYRKLLSQKTGLMDDLLTGRVRVTPLLEREPAEAT